MTPKRKTFTGSINGQISIGQCGNIIKDFSKLQTTSRFKREVAFYQYCLSTDNLHVPKLIEINYKNKIIKLEYIDSFNTSYADDNYIENFATFINTLNKPIHDEKLKKYALNGEEACFSIQDVAENCRCRLKSISIEGCDGKWLKLANKAFMMVGENNGQSSFGKICLNPSDNGVHNYLKTDDKCVFIDFEYAGLDSYYKIYYDFILHPANKINDNNYHKILDQFNSSINGCRLVFDLYIYKLFCIWWLLRLINSTTEKSLDNRVRQGNLRQDERIDFKIMRLNTAQIFWEKIKNA